MLYLWKESAVGKWKSFKPEHELRPQHLQNRSRQVIHEQRPNADVLYLIVVMITHWRNGLKKYFPSHLILTRICLDSLLILQCDSTLVCVL